MRGVGQSWTPLPLFETRAAWTSPLTEASCWLSAIFCSRCCSCWSNSSWRSRSAWKKGFARRQRIAPNCARIARELRARLQLQIAAQLLDLLVADAHLLLDVDEALDLDLLLDLDHALHQHLLLDEHL